MHTDFTTLAALLSSSVVMTAHAEIYMSPEQGAKILIPAKTLEKINVDLSKEEVDKIEKSLDIIIRNKSLTIWKAKNRDCVFIDQVIGKHEFITYAIAVSNDGRIKGIEILEYRESYGHQIRNAKWREQFIGKDKNSPLKLDQDIQNISGATLSSSHIAAGAKRILQTYDIIKNRI